MMAPLDAPKKAPLDVARTIYRTLGWRGFYSGFVPVILRAFPVNSCALFVYEGLMRLMKAEQVSGSFMAYFVELTKLHLL